jgi:hypothetical protein
MLAMARTMRQSPRIMFLALLHRIPHPHAGLLLHLLVKVAIVCTIAALLTWLVHRIFKLTGCALLAIFLFFCTVALVLRFAMAIFLHR